MRIGVVFWIFTFLVMTAGNAQTRFSGKVVDEQNQPLPFATVIYLNANQTNITSEKGDFSFILIPHQDSVRIRVNFLGKQSQYISYAIENTMPSPTITLKELSLTLDEVSVLPAYTEDGQSNSSIQIDRQAIDQLQAFSLVDVMNALPGKKTQPLNIHSLSMLNFRGGMSMSNGVSSSSDADVRNLNNSLGIAIIMDDIRLSNDANMQAQRFSSMGFNGSRITSSIYRDSYFGTQGSKAYDTPFQGIDLRDIPTTNIERIEVIQGIAPARYGEVTDGAVIINRQAGKSPFVVSFNINGGSTGSSVSKGFQLPKDWGAINFSTNWTYSNADPKDKVKSYNRYSQSVIWTRKFGSVKNTLSLDYSGRNDRKKQDPEDETLRTSQFNNNQFGFSNRLRYDIESKWIKDIQFNMGLSLGNQKSYASYAMNRGPIIPSINLDTAGIYEGSFVDGRYVAEEIIIGRPVNGSLSLSANSSLEWLGVVNNFNYGVNYSLSNNGGQGIVSDPDRPRWRSVNDQNLRPYSFESLPSAQNIGFYIEDHLQMKIGNRSLSNNIGLRYDIQNGYGTLQPRINSRLRWNKHWGFTIGAGLASKAPTLAHLYPGPVYIDYNLIMVTTGEIDKSLYLLFTDRFTPDNSKLKPSKSFQLELGIEYRNNLFTSSIYAYHKRNWDGFAQRKQLRRYVLPQYDYYFDETSGQYMYEANGKDTVMGGFLDQNMINGASSQTWGIDWFLSIAKLSAINTSISLNSTFTYNAYSNVGLEGVTPQQTTALENGQVIQSVFYAPTKNNNMTLMTKLNAVTHLPRIGFVLNFSADIHWMARQNITSNIYPVAYLDRNIQYVELSDEESRQSTFDKLIKTSTDATSVSQPMTYATISMGIEKEIRKNFRINLRGYNIFDIRPYKIYQLNNGLEQIFNPNTKPSLTIGTTIKF